MKGIIFLGILILLTKITLCQNLIQSDTSIEKTIRVNDTIDLQFLDWPSPGICWTLYSKYDTSMISMRLKSTKPLTQFPKGGKWISTIQYKAKKPGEVKLEYYWGRPWLKEQKYLCKLSIIIK
jgi:hypothetical protein